MINGISANDSLSLGGSDGIGSQDLDRKAFMRLLIAQMKNQNPLEPTKNEDMIAQLAQFSTLEEMKGVNENLVALAVLQQGNALLEQVTGSSALIGKDVSWTNDEGVESSGVVDSVRVIDGQAVLNVNGTDVPLTWVSGVSLASNDGDSGDSGDSNN